MSEKLSYKATQLAVYHYLLNRHQTNPNFSFSLRQKFGDGEGKGLFIGTEQSNYFAFTLWCIPIKYAHATGDLLDYAIRWNDDGSAHVCLHFQMLRSGTGSQNQGNLLLAETLKSLPLRWTKNKDTEALLKLTCWGAPALHTPAEVVRALDKLISQTITLIDQAITQNAVKSAPDWVGRRLQQDEFEKMRQLMLRKRGHWLTTPFIEILDLMPQPLNQILYGPPGTGKTYHTALRAIGLLERLTDAQVKEQYPTREAIRLRYDAYQQAGRIQFVTFHQAFSYEDFIEGIKPVLTDAADTEETGQELGYTIADGIFKVMAQRGVYALHLQQQQRLAATAGPAQAVALDFDTVFERFIDQLRERQAAEEQILFYTKHNSELRVDSISESGTVYFRYANGSSKNLPQVTRNGLRKINNDNPVDEAGWLPEDAIEVRHGRDRSVYWAAFREFVKFRAQTPTDDPAPLAPQNLDDALHRVITNPKIAAEITQGFNYLNLTSADFNAAPRMVLIIDEINRGNVASIFGELITLLEDGKRAGRPEQLTARLPYSKTDFTVPPNLFLLGTMNTADRSVEALDTALRRRFSFTEMQPEPAVIRAQVGTGGIIGEGAEAVDVARILEVLNSRLEQLLDHDHCLGHALLLLSSPDVDSLRTAFERNIVPLLQEYFFGDWGKIGLVLGEKFVTAVPRTGVGRYPLATFRGYDSAGLHDKPLYRLTSPDTWDAAAFQSIYPATA